MKKNNKVNEIIKKLINKAAENKKVGTYVHSPYEAACRLWIKGELTCPMWGYPDGKLVGLSLPVYEEDEEGETMFCGYETVITFNALEKDILRRAGFNC